MPGMLLKWPFRLMAWILPAPFALVAAISTIVALFNASARGTALTWIGIAYVLWAFGVILDTQRFHLHVGCALEVFDRALDRTAIATPGTFDRFRNPVPAIDAATSTALEVAFCFAGWAAGIVWRNAHDSPHLGGSVAFAGGRLFLQWCCPGCQPGRISLFFKSDRETSASLGATSHNESNVSHNWMISFYSRLIVRIT